MNILFKFLRCAALMAVTMAWMMPASAQHPFTLTTSDDVSNHTETLYWIESNGATGFYAIPHTNNSNVSTTNMPNLKALWYFMDAGIESNTQYYYIVNHNTGYYLKLDGTLGGDNTIKIASFGSGGDAYKFSISGSEGEWILYPKSGNGNYWVNKKSGNVAYDRYLKSSNYDGSPDANSKWNIVARNSVTWAHPITNSTNSDKHYYKIQNATSKGSAYYMSIDDASDPYATVSDVDNNKRIWYFMEADSDNTIPNLKYYYIVNAVTGKYLKFTGTANGSSQASSLQLYEHDGTETGEIENRFQFMVLNAIGTTYSAYSIMPKLEINYYDNKNASLSPSNNYGNSLSNDMKIGVYNDRGTDNNYAHWLFVETNYVPVAVEAPVITFDNVNQKINITCGTAGASIYYTLDETTPDANSTPFTAAFPCTSPCTIMAIAVNSVFSSEVTTYNLQKVATPNFSLNTNTNEVTITCTTGASVYYSIGSENTPSIGVNPYTAPFDFPYAQSNQPLKAIAVKEGWINSDMEQQTIILNCYMPTLSFDNDNQQVTLSCEDAGATMYYTTNGSTPDPGQAGTTQYSGSFEVTLGSTVKAIATHSGYHNSQVAILPIAQSHDYSNDYLTFNVLTDGTICWKAFGDLTKTISYRINGGSWRNITSTSAGATINVNEDDVVQFKGSNETYATSKSNYSGFEGGTATFDIEGNIHSLIYGDNFADNNTLPNNNYIFCSLFKKALVISAENLILPATTMTECCYRAMFSKCTTLTTPPALPATTLAQGCYWYMFEQCAITTAPELNAATLIKECYGHMFEGCSNLNYIKCLATTGFSSSSCLTDWVNGVSQTGTFVKDENTTWTTGASGIPTGWVVNDHLAPPDDPVITCDGDFITITCDTYGADIYYRLGQTGSYSSYSAPIAIHENTVVEAYAVKDELSSHIVSETCIAIKPYHFAGMEITPGPLYYGSNGYEIKDSWNYDSYNSIYGKTVGSTYFNFIELGQLYESSVFSTTDGDIEKVLDPLDGWRVPTNAEWASILGTTRSGSTVNGASNQHYAMIQLPSVSGLLVFPDGETITGIALSNMDNTTPNTGITESQLNEYLSQGCVFLPGSGYYDGAWNNGQYYWSSTENNLATGYVSSGDDKDKETCYFPVYLVKNDADEATRLLRTWTYNGNEVELPYSVNAIDGHSSSYKRSTFNFTTDVKIKESQPTYLWFQHADQSADIYVNNVKVTTHWGGYTSFFVDITNYVHVGVNNIKVALCNTKRNTLAPYTGDFNMNATLGEVKLISSPVVPTPDYGYDGFHITSTVTAQEATITVKTKVPTGATLTCSIKGTNCDYTSVPQTSTGNEITFTTTITNPHLWNGTLDPYLYDVTLTIEKDGVVYHKFKRGYGLRFYEYVINETVGDNENYTGFLLNGSPYLLRGVCMHSDLEGKANALTAEDIDNDFELLKELGCNFVRLAHYPHPKEVYDWCDKRGIIVQTEAPCVNDFYFQKTLDQDYYNHLYIQYEDMVRQHFNHPCIMFWGLGNEIKTDDKPAAKTQLEAYRTFIRGIDSERWVGYVVDHNKSNPSSEFGGPNMDWFGCNIYVGWYIDKTINDPTSQLNKRVKSTITDLSKPLAFSEYGCGGTPNCHSDNFKATTTTGNNPRHDIEYQMWLHEGHIAAIKNKPELLFTSQWQLFDIAVYNRTEGYKVCPDGETVYDNNELQRLNNKGLVERDHRTKKDTYYLYKAWWNQTDKFVHICGKDYEKLTDRVIKCYTNDGSELSLYVNGVFVETVTVTDNIATFTERNFNPGDVVRVNGATSNDTFTFTDYSENYVFTTNGNWNNAANWSPAVPAAARNVTINAACTVPKEYTAQTNNITIGNGGSLTIADGGQLYHNNQGVIATVQKNIKAYTVSQNEGELLTNGWYFIASPITDGYTPAGSMIANTYDLYRLSNTTWENFKNTTDHPDFTTLNNGKGYLYANSADVTLLFTGTLKPYAASESMSVSTGWNLIGNPFAYNVYANRSYYKMNEAKTGVEAVSTFSTSPIAPCTGILVEAESDDNIILSKEAPTQSQGNNGSLQIALSQANTRSNALLDNAIVSFNEDNQLGKFYFGTQNANIYIPQNDKEYAIAFVGRDAMHCVPKEMPVNFKANENGTYTITVNAEDLEMPYLHLIDNMTDADVDLLQTPEYTFKAKTTDHESRFKLVFVRGEADDDNETFAFIHNGKIILTADACDASLQVIDQLGRILVSGDAKHCISTAGMTPGVYVLCLIQDDKVRTQKIIIQ